MVARRHLIAMTIAGLALAGCSSSSKSGSGAGTTTSTAAPKLHPKVTIIARDDTFTLPARIPSGYVDVTLDNRGKEDHHAQLVKLGSMTFAQFKALAAKTDIGKVKPGAVFVGGPNDAAAGKSTTATLKLDPGAYAVVCLIPGADGKPHAAKGMIGEVRVVRTAASSDTAPVANSTIVLGDFSFTLPSGFTGKGTVDISNQGNQIHELNLFKLMPGKTVADAKKFLFVPPGSPAPAGPEPLTEVTGVVGLTPQQHAWLNLDLTPGNYLLVCFFPDPTKGGLPHALEGMIKEFTIT